jgi:hypothetical protein
MASYDLGVNGWTAPRIMCKSTFHIHEQAILRIFFIGYLSVGVRELPIMKSIYQV